MEKKVIAIDLNETIRDFRTAFANQYCNKFGKGAEKLIDMEQFEIDKAFPFYESDGRIDLNRRHKFQYEDYAFEIYARADTTDKFIGPYVTNWVYNELFDYDPEENPEILIVSPLEGNVSIPSTLSFLSRIGMKFRNIYFPVDSMTIWDKCDILITANPKLINGCPDGKTVIKIEAPYNKDAEAELTFKTLKDLIFDPRHIVNCLLEEREIPEIIEQEKEEQNEE